MLMCKKGLVTKVFKVIEKMIQTKLTNCMLPYCLIVLTSVNFRCGLEIKVYR